MPADSAAADAAERGTGRAAGIAGRQAAANGQRGQRWHGRTGAQGRCSCPRSRAAARSRRRARRRARRRPDYGAVQRELKDLRQLLESELATLTWNDKRLREPLQARVLEQLSMLDISPDVAGGAAARDAAA